MEDIDATAAGYFLAKIASMDLTHTLAKLRRA